MELFQEIIENEKARLELFKWKIILVAGLGAAASGLVGSKPIHPSLSAALIPFVCIYVDMLAQDLTLRIAVFSRYLVLVYHREQEPTDSQYVAFVEEKADRMDRMPTLGETAGKFWNQLRRDWPSSAYGVGFYAQYLSTGLLTGGVIVWGFFFLSCAHALFLSVAAGLGIVGLFWTYLAHRRRLAGVSEISSLPEVIANH